MVNRGVVLIVLGRGLHAIIAILSLTIMTALLAKEQVGIFYLMNAVLSYIGLAFIAPVGYYCNRQLFVWQAGQVLFQRLNLYFLYAILICLVLLPVASIFRTTLPHLAYSDLMVFVLLGIVPWTIVSALVSYLNGLGHRGIFVLLSTLNLVAILVASAAFAYLGAPTAWNWFLGQFLAQVIFAAISLVVFRRHVRSEARIVPRLRELDLGKIRQVWVFAYPVAISSFCLWFILEGYRYLLEPKLGLAYVAEISVGFTIAHRASTAVESIVQQLYFPAFYRESAQGGRDEVGSALRTVVLEAHPLYFVTTLGVIFLAPFLLRILAGEAYQGAVFFVVCGAVFHLLRKYAALASLSSHALYHTSMMIWPHLYAASALFVLLYVLPPQWAHDLVPLVLLLSGALLLLILNRRVQGELSFSLLPLLGRLDPMTWMGGGAVVGILLWPWASSLWVSFLTVAICGLMMSVYLYRRCFAAATA